MVPWGEGGSLIPFELKKGGYLNVTDLVKNFGEKPNDQLDIYGMQRDEFKETYAECSFTGEFYNPKLREAFGQEKKRSKKRRKIKR